MQEFQKDSRLCLLNDSVTGEEVWLRRHGLHLHDKEYLEYIMDMEQRGAAQPMTQKEIETFFLGEEYEYWELFGTGHYSSKKRSEQNSGICYHPTDDIEDSFYKDRPEAPAVGHILYSQSNDELTIQSIAVDAEFHFRKLMYQVLLDELKLFVVKAVGYQYVEKISALLRGETERRFYEHNHFRTVQMPEGIEAAYWLPEFEGRQKENRWDEKRKGETKQS